MQSTSTSGKRECSVKASWDDMTQYEHNLMEILYRYQNVKISTTESVNNLRGEFRIG